MASEIGIKIGLQGAEAVQGGLQRVVGSMGQLGGQVDTVRNALTTLAPTLAGALSVGGIAAFVRGTVNAIDAMNDLADATGASIEEISKLDQVARRNGATLDQVGGMLVKFNAQLKEADGKNGASIALEAIGLSAAKLRQLDPAEALRQTAVALAGFADDGNKARAVQELFGKSIREAAPFLKDLAEAGELNASVTTAQAVEAEKFNKQMAQLSTNITDAARALVSDFLPALNDSISMMLRFSKNGGVLSGFFTLLMSQFKDARVQATLEEIGRLEGRLSNPNVTGFNRSSLQKELQDALDKLRELQGESLKARTALDAALGRPNAGAGRGDDVNPPFAVPAPSVIDIAGEQAKRKAAEEAAAAQLKQQDAYDKLRVSIEERISAGQLELEQGTALTEAQRLKIKIDADLAAGLIKLTDPQKAVLNGKLSDLAASERQLIADKEAAKGAKALADARVEARRAEEKAIDDFEKEQRDAAAAALASVDTRIKSLQAEAEASDRSRAMNISLAEAIELVAIERLKERQARYQEGSEPWLAVQREIEARQKLRGLIADRAVIDANQKAADEAARDWQRTADQIGQSLSDALMQGGKSAWEYIKGLFRSMVLRPVIQAIVNPIAGAFTSAMGFAGSASASTGAAGASGGFGSLLSAGASLLNGGLGSSLGLQLVNSSLGQSLGLSTLQNIGGNMIAGPTGLGSMVGSGLGMLGNGFMGYGISKALSGGYSAGGAVNTIAGLASAVPGIGPIAGVVGGLVNRAFGMKAKEMRDSGIQGSLSGGAATGQQFQDWFQKGGWFRSNRRGTNLSALGDDTSAALNAGAMGVLDSTRAWAQALKLPGDALSSVTTQFKIKLTGDATKDQAEIQALFGRYAADLATTFQGQLAPFQKAGEAISDTLQRLAGLQTFSEAINEFGGVFSRVANLSVDAREQLLGFAGGMEAFVAKTQSFAANYYEEAELAGIQARQVRDQLASLGIDTQIFSRADFRRLVEGTDVSNEQGRQRLSQLLTLADAFAPVGRYLEEINSKVQTAVESMAAGLQRFALTVNEFGGVFSRVANLSGDARQHLIDLAGGMEAFANKTQSFAQNYYEEAELAGIQARQVREQLASLGINAEIFTRADFRRLVEGTDVSNEQGRQRLSQLLTLADAFAPVGRFLEANGGSLETVANMAPAIADLRGMLDVQAPMGNALANLNTLANMAPTTGVVQQILGGNSMEGLSSLTDATTAGTNATVSTLERLIARVGELEGALVKALDKSGRAVADQVYYDQNFSWSGGA